MSQQKVDKYKADKANRSQIIKKEKRTRRVEIICVTVIMVGLVGWFANSYYAREVESRPATERPIVSGAIDDYLNNLNAPVEEEAPSEEAPTEETSEEATTKE